MAAPPLHRGRVAANVQANAFRHQILLELAGWLAKMPAYPLPLIRQLVNTRISFCNSTTLS